MVGFWGPVLESGSEIGFNVSSSEKLTKENSSATWTESRPWNVGQNMFMYTTEKKSSWILVLYAHMNVPNLKRIRRVYPCALGWLGCKSASSTFSWSHRSSIHLLHVWWCLWCQATPQVDWQHAIWRWVAAFPKDMLRIETGLYVCTFTFMLQEVF